jgi:2-C-methyl-D-erythritol 2,4-cyclodiphosphate synthase
LEHVAGLLKQKGFVVVNIDSQVVMERPKIKPYIEDMRANMARALSVGAEDVSVKATTEEKLGFTGDGSGAKAYAVALLRKA